MRLLKGAFFLLISIIFISSLFYLYHETRVRRSADVNGVFDSAMNVGQESAFSPCRTSGAIEYLYYPAPSRSPQANNKFGMYIYAENKNYFKLAQELVNSNGGDWGYVLIPYNVRDRDYEKWGRAFKEMRERHLIPVVQLWDINPDNYEKETKEAARFLNSFIWPVRQRYISAYNEMNDARFWRGKIDPAGYAKILRYTMAAFKKENLDFFIMNGAFNTSAADTFETMDAEKYMKKMDEAVPGIFQELDGWASHPYPQPNFSGNPSDRGRWSIRAYEDELEFLKKEFGVTKDLPVFITETGWAHAEGEGYNGSFLPVARVAENFKWAFENVWLKDEKVAAVMPFTIYYPAPFDHFAWVNSDGVPYHHYQVIKSMKKIKGNPASLQVGNSLSMGCR